MASNTERIIALESKVGELKKLVGNLQIDAEDAEELRKEEPDGINPEYIRDTFKRLWANIGNLNVVTKYLEKKLEEHSLSPAVHDPFYIAQLKKDAKK